MVKNLTGINHQTSKFRQSAEEELRKRSLESSSHLSEAEIQKLIYELQVHQIELEMMLDEQENTEMVLRESELRYRSLIESSRDAIYAVDEKGQYQFANHLFAAIYGKTPDFFIGKTFWDVYDKEHADLRYETAERVFSTGKSESVEYEVNLSDKTIYFLSTSNPVKDETGKIVSILTHSSDITCLKHMQNDLAELNQFNTQILNSVQDGIIVFDQDLHFKVWNPFMVKISGIPESKVLGKHPSEIFQSDEFPFLYEAKVFGSIEKVLNGEPVEKIDFPFSLPENGKSGWTSYKSMPLRDSHGEITGVIGIIHDITERKRTEKYFEDVIDKNPMSIQIVDKEGFTLKGNDAFCSLFGALPPPDFSIFKDSQLKGGGFEEVIERIKKGEVVHFPDMQYNVRDSVSGYPDVPAWIRTVVFPLMDSGGEPEKFVFMHENIMERKQAEEALENEKQRLSSILHGTSAGTWEWNIQTGETIYNELWAGLIGYTLEELSPVSFDTWIKHCHPDDRKKSKEIFELYLKGKLPYYECEIRMKHKNGNWIWVIDRGKINKWDIYGNPLIMSGTHQDITERKHVEEELRKKADELANVNHALEQYAFTNQELKQFAYTASHQLQEPIRTVSNYMQIIKEDYSQILDIKALHYIQIVNDALVRMGMLINSLLDFSQLGRNKKLINVDCKQLIANVIEDISFLVEKSNASIEVGKMPVLNLYETEVRELFQNLITNAIKFQRKDNKPDIKIRSTKRQNYWEFSVSDNGIGIDLVHSEKIFDIFQRLHINEEVYEGQGIGLTYCKKIVNLHHGEIWVESNIGKGTTFYFTLKILND